MSHVKDCHFKRLLLTLTRSWSSVTIHITIVKNCLNTGEYGITNYYHACNSIKHTYDSLPQSIEDTHRYIIVCKTSLKISAAIFALINLILHFISSSTNKSAKLASEILFNKYIKLNLSAGCYPSTLTVIRNEFCLLIGSNRCSHYCQPPKRPDFLPIMTNAFFYKISLKSCQKLQQKHKS